MFPNLFVFLFASLFYDVELIFVSGQLPKLSFTSFLRIKYLAKELLTRVDMNYKVLDDIKRTILQRKGKAFFNI